MVSSDQIIECAPLPPCSTNAIALQNASTNRTAKVSQCPHSTSSILLLSPPGLLLPTLNSIQLQALSSPYNLAALPPPATAAGRTGQLLHQCCICLVSPFIARECIHLKTIWLYNNSECKRCTCSLLMIQI